MSPNLVKYAYGSAPLEQHHKIEKNKIKSLDGTKVQQAKWLFFVMDFLQIGNIKNKNKGYILSEIHDF
jgi:hypothetical protein